MGIAHSNLIKSSVTESTRRLTLEDEISISADMWGMVSNGPSLVSPKMFGASAPACGFAGAQDL